MHECIFFSLIFIKQIVLLKSEADVGEYNIDCDLKQIIKLSIFMSLDNTRVGHLGSLPHKIQQPLLYWVPHNGILCT